MNDKQLLRQNLATDDWKQLDLTKKRTIISDQRQASMSERALSARLFEINRKRLLARGLGLFVQTTSDEIETRRSLSRQTMMIAISRAIDMHLRFVDKTNVVDEID